MFNFCWNFNFFEIVISRKFSKLGSGISLMPGYILSLQLHSQCTLKWQNCIHPKDLSNWGISCSNPAFPLFFFFFIWGWPHSFETLIFNAFWAMDLEGSQFIIFIFGICSFWVLLFVCQSQVLWAVAPFWRSAAVSPTIHHKSIGLPPRMASTWQLLP